MAKKIVVTIGGDSDPYWVFASPELEAEVAVIDWDEVNEGAYSYDQLLDLAEDTCQLAPHVAKDLRIAAVKQMTDEERADEGIPTNYTVENLCVECGNALGDDFIEIDGDEYGRPDKTVAVHLQCLENLEYEND